MIKQKQRNYGESFKEALDELNDKWDKWTFIGHSSFPSAILNDRGVNPREFDEKGQKINWETINPWRFDSSELNVLHKKLNDHSITVDVINESYSENRLLEVRVISIEIWNFIFERRSKP